MSRLPVVETAPDDYDLQQSWADVLQAFAQTAKIELRPDRLLTPEDVIAQLKAKRGKDEADNAKYKAVKDVLSKTVTCIQTLGGIAASGASMVFGPANLCYSGLSYLLSVGSNYSNIFSSLEALLKQVSDVMERMVVYLRMRSIDLPLRKIVHEVLQNIVSICGLAIKVLHGNKILKFLKVFAFNEDDGVKAAMESLRALVDREAQMKTTLTYAIVKEGFADVEHNVSGVRSVVDKLADDAMRREAESVDRKQLEKIRDTLKVQKEAEAQSQLHSRLWSEVVQETGQWLQENESYKAWSDRTTTFNKVIFLSADDGFGKTFLMTTAIHSLHRRYNRQLDSTARTMIAYYHWLPKDSKATHGATDEFFSVDRVLKTIALQFAQGTVYRKELVALCDKWVEPETIEELAWTLLSPCYKSNEVFYILIDGLELADERQLDRFAQIMKGVSTRFNPEQQSHVRLLLSGRVLVTNSLAGELQYPNVVIDVASNNRPDIEKFTQNRLSTTKLLQGDSEQIKTLRQEVFDVLTAEAHGDFVNIDLLLKEISTKQWPAEIREVLANAKAGTRRSDTIAREITRCNDTLLGQEIRDLNTLLLWVLSAKRSMRVSELNGVLFLKNNETSLRPLHERIRDKYSSFFHMDEVVSNEGPSGWLVSLVSDSIRDYFKAQESNVAAEGDAGKLQENEVKIVRRFLNSVCDQELYDKFGFDEFFSSKLNNSTVMIDVDLERASSTLLLGCLQALTSTTPELTALALYAVDWFPYHLADVDLSMTDPAVKMAIGKLLASLLTEEATIALWWNWQTIVIRNRWFYDDTNVELVLSWFKDSAVTKTFSESNKAWVKTLTSNSSPDADVLEHLVKFLCKKLFQQQGWPVVETYSCIAAYRAKLKNRIDTTVKKIDRDVQEQHVTSEVIVDNAIWASKFVGIDPDKDYEWTRCIGRTLRAYGQVDEAIKYYKKAITLTDDALYAEWGLASAYADQGDYQTAIDIVEGLRNRLKDGVPQVENPTLTMLGMCTLLAGWYREVKRYEEALEIFDESLKENPDGYFLYKEKILLFCSMENYQRIFGLLRELSTQRDAKGISKRSRLWHLNAFVDPLYQSCMLAAKVTNQIPLLVSILRQAAKDTLEPSYVPLAGSLKGFWRVTNTFFADEYAWPIAKTDEEKSIVVESWERNAQEAGVLGITNLRQLIGKHLAQVYVDRMRQFSPEAPEVQSIINKLSDLAFEDSAEEEQWVIGLNTGLLLARYESVQGNEEGAMKVTRGIVKVGLDLLSDEDPDNDWQGYSRLAAALMYCGDDENALAAWSLIRPMEYDEKKGETAAARNAEHVNGVPTTNGDSKGEEDPKSTAVKAEAGENAVGGEPAGPLSYMCDGDCDPTTSWTYANDIYVCKDCLDVMFDEKCLGLLKAGKLTVNVCNPKHEFLHVPKWDLEEAEKRGTDHVRLRGEKVPVSEWLNQLRNKWGFEQPAPAAAADMGFPIDSFRR